MILPAPRILLIDTSAQSGLIGLAQGTSLVAEHRLESGRHHGRDFAPALANLLSAQSCSPQQLDGIIVSRGPGSFTGLRIGLMSAKTLAYVLRCPLYAIDTFAVIAAGSPPECNDVEVIADAQKDAVYVQRFRRESSRWQAITHLAAVDVSTWVVRCQPDCWVSGPGLLKYRTRLSASIPIAPPECGSPTLDNLLRIAWPRIQENSHDDPLLVEPLYLRASSAELQWNEKQPKPQS